MQQYNNNLLPSNSVHPDEILKSLMRREGDNMERNFLKYRDTVRDVFRDLNLVAIKYTERRLIEVDKRTNSIEIPCNYLKLASVGIIDECNKIQMLIRNNNILDDIIDVSVKKRCGCECGCQDDLCGTIKNYEAILEDVTETMPDDSTKVFTKITRKTLYPDGSVMMDYTFPIRLYENGEWTDTVLTNETELICKLEMETCGCVKNCQVNRDVLLGCINADSLSTDYGCTINNDCGIGCQAESQMMYNFTELGNRISLPSNISYDKVLLRFYVEPKIKEIRVPLIAKPAFMAGVKHYATEYDESVAQSRQETYKRSYNSKKDLLALDLSKCSLKEIYSVLTPKRRMV